MTEMSQKKGGKSMENMNLAIQDELRGTAEMETENGNEVPVEGNVQEPETQNMEENAASEQITTEKTEEIKDSKLLNKKGKGYILLQKGNNKVILLIHENNLTGEIKDCQIILDTISGIKNTDIKISKADLLKENNMKWTSAFNSYNINLNKDDMAEMVEVVRNIFITETINETVSVGGECDIKNIISEISEMVNKDKEAAKEKKVIIENDYFGIDRETLEKYLEEFELSKSNFLQLVRDYEAVTGEKLMRRNAGREQLNKNNKRYYAFYKGEC